MRPVQPTRGSKITITEGSLPVQTVKRVAVHRLCVDGPLVPPG
jgi:hypothetical protein